MSAVINALIQIMLSDMELQRRVEKKLYRRLETIKDKRRKTFEMRYINGSNKQDRNGITESY